MKILNKGGVWKNAEDEILKAAVMKYGFNQWPRIASLMKYKSASQCKARWYGWLDPKINKSEWSREEDERLLHLIRLFPTQWLTIAPIIGRTPVQSFERYDSLTKMADGIESSTQMSNSFAFKKEEIEMIPECKPPRPDAVDADEEEEMLAEARARLANTRGKKAKRKLREKQMEEARRLAKTQKKRELKAAGIELAPKWTSTRSINYNKEVPFEKEPITGLYDTSNEKKSTKVIRDNFRPTSVKEIEGLKRREVEMALRKEDVKRERLATEKDINSINSQTLHIMELKMNPLINGIINQITI
jgi:pre-mRNA-splicing factor CDC5/CEF1